VAIPADSGGGMKNGSGTLRGCKVPLTDGEMDGANAVVPEETWVVQMTAGDLAGTAPGRQKAKPSWTAGSFVADDSPDEGSDTIQGRKDNPGALDDAPIEMGRGERRFAPRDAFPPRLHSQQEFHGRRTGIPRAAAQEQQDFAAGPSTGFG
jgi:hypothetical protein